MRSILELTVFICGLAVLKRKTTKDTIIMILLGVGIAFVLHLAVPFL